MTEREVLTYESFGVAVPRAGQQVVDDGFDPDLILSIARGGLGLGMGWLRAGRQEPVAINVEFYTGVTSASTCRSCCRRPRPRSTSPGCEVLIADDVADTGGTLELVHEFCADHVAEARTAVIYEKPRSVIKADYVWRRTDRWIDFPWSVLPPVVDAAGESSSRR